MPCWVCEMCHINTKLFLRFTMLDHLLRPNLAICKFLLFFQSAPPHRWITLLGEQWYCKPIVCSFPNRFSPQSTCKLTQSIQYNPNDSPISPVWWPWQSQQVPPPSPHYPPTDIIAQFPDRPSHTPVIPYYYFFQWFSELPPNYGSHFPSSRNFATQSQINSNCWLFCCGLLLTLSFGSLSRFCNILLLRFIGFWIVRNS